MGDRLPPAVRTAAMQLGRRLRDARETDADDDDPAAVRTRLEDLLDDYGFTARLREDEERTVLVCYPGEWVADGTVRRDRIETIDRAVELPLSGPGDPADWDTIDRHNRRIADDVAERHGDVHGTNARAFADYMSNHYARRIEEADDEAIATFLEEYYPRNVWPTADEREVIDGSVELTLHTARTD